VNRFNTSTLQLFNVLAVHFENLVFLLFVAVALLFQLLARAATKTGQSGKGSDQSTRRPTTTRPTPPPIPRRPMETDEERIRKFLEALGQPTGSPPPRPVVHRTDIPPRPVAPVRPPSPYFPTVPRRPSTSEERAKRPVVVQETPADEPGAWLRKLNRPNEPEIKPRRVLVPKSPEPTAFEVHTKTTPAEPPVTVDRPGQSYAITTQARSGPLATETSITAMLKSATGLRAAVILREIFGPPRSLQPLELV